MLQTERTPGMASEAIGRDEERLADALEVAGGVGTGDAQGRSCICD
jgi:hypothetical protein